MEGGLLLRQISVIETHSCCLHGVSVVLQLNCDLIFALLGSFHLENCSFSLPERS